MSAPSAAKGTVEAIAWGPDGLVPVVVQDRLTGEIRMLAHANAEALARTLASASAHFYSRSRGKLWRKGEESGHELRVSEVWTDCDADTLLYLVDPVGPTCHTGRATCFFRVVGEDATIREAPAEQARALLARLWHDLELRRDASATQSYTRTLLDAGPDTIAAKVREEAGELARALTGESPERVVSEAADVVYHLFVALLARGTTLRDLEAELAKRHGVSGLAEKAARSNG